MPIQLTRSRRGLYDMEEYLTYRGEFKSADNKLIPLVPGYEPIVYMKCLVNSHQFPYRPELGNRFISYEDFVNWDFENNPFICPTCQEQDVKFKVCLLEDQPRTWNDPNHRYIKLHRDRTLWFPDSRYYGRAEEMIGVARPLWEDYFDAAHTNHNDPFAEHEVVTTGKREDIFSEGTTIAQPLSEEEAVPPEDVYDEDGVYIIRRKGDDMKAQPAFDVKTGKYTLIRQNYDFYRAILYIVTQYSITV